MFHVILKNKTGAKTLVTWFYNRAPLTCHIKSYVGIVFSIYTFTIKNLLNNRAVLTCNIKSFVESILNSSFTTKKFLKKKKTPFDKRNFCSMNLKVRLKHIFNICFHTTNHKKVINLSRLGYVRRKRVKAKVWKTKSEVEP